MESLFESKVIPVDNLVAIPGRVDPNFSVLIIFPEHKEYGPLKDHFKNFGHSYLSEEKKYIYVDGEEAKKKYFTKKHLAALEAREIGSSFLKHRTPYSKNTERNADIAGIHILEKKGEYESAQILRKKYNEDLSNYVFRKDEKIALNNYLQNLK